MTAQARNRLIGYLDDAVRVGERDPAEVVARAAVAIAIRNSKRPDPDLDAIEAEIASNLDSVRELAARRIARLAP